jgi:hypothetical protein
MRIDIIHMRDPDSSCDHEVYVDGVPITDFEIHSFDPGAGYEMNEWEEDKQARIENTPDYLKARIAAIIDEMEPTYRKWGY